MPQAASSSNQVRKAQAKKAARIQARRKVGALSQHLVKPKTHSRYEASFKEFLQYHHLRPEFKIEDYEEFDQKVGEFLKSFGKQADQRAKPLTLWPHYSSFDRCSNTGSLTVGNYSKPGIS